MKTIARLLMFCQPVAGWVFLSTLLAAGTIASNIGLLGTSAYLIAQAALHPSVAVLQVAIVGVRFFGIARSVLRYLERLVSHSTNFRILAGLRTWFFARLEPLAPAGLIETRRGDLLDRVVADIDNLEDFYVRAVAPPFTAILVTLGMGIFLGIVDARLAGVLVIGLVFSGAGVPWLARMLGRQPGRQMVNERAELSAGLVDGILGLADLTAFRREQDHFSGLQQRGRAAARAQVRLAAWGGLANALNGLISNLTLWIVLWIAIPLVRGGGMDGVMLAVVALITLASFEATLPLGPAAQRLEAVAQSTERLFEITSATPAVIPPKTPISIRTIREEPHLEVTGLTFRYFEGTAPALLDFSLNLPVGKRVGIVGPSGSGKSTLFQLLMRFWDVPPGSIRLGGRDLRDYAFEDVRRQMAIIGQNPFLFRGTIRMNLQLAAEEAESEELMAVLRQVRLEEWVKSLPRGLDTWVGERGTQISGGERQRLAVARALLQRAPIWLADEPTAHLDPANRRAVAAALVELSRGKSLIWITHELSELDQMDEVIVLQDGRTIERGKPAELAAQQGWYARWRENRVF